MYTMYPLIEIKTVPIEIEMKVTSAKLEYSRGAADLEISHDAGGISIRSRAIRLNLDTFESRNSFSPSRFRSIEQGGQKGQQAAYQATASSPEQGQLMLHAKIGQEVIAQFAAQAQSKGANIHAGAESLAATSSQLSFGQGELNIRFELDKLNFDWRFNRPEFEFTPGDIEISVTQQPDVIIKYVGGPLYVPPSTDPNYDPVDTQA